MLVLKHLNVNNDFEVTEENFEDIKDALEYDYHVWASIGENCSFYYKGIQIGTDNHKTIDENIPIIEAQMRYIDSITCK